MDSACGLLINLGEAIGEPLSTCSKLNKAYPEMTLFSLNSPSAPLSSLDPLQGIRANKMGKFRHCENDDGYLPHIQCKGIQCERVNALRLIKTDEIKTMFLLSCLY